MTIPVVRFLVQLVRFLVQSVLARKIPGRPIPSAGHDGDRGFLYHDSDAASREIHHLRGAGRLRQEHAVEEACGVTSFSGIVRIDDARTGRNPDRRKDSPAPARYTHGWTHCTG